MSLGKTVDQIQYPESDGKPMGETDLHRDWMSRILDILRQRYRGQRVYVASDLLVYYEEGDPSKFVVPDDFVVKDADPGRRRTFKIWEEGKVPDVVFEVTSRASRSEDRQWKPQKYARIGVKEYFLYDPTADYLDPPLQGFRLVEHDYRRILPDESGVLKCEELDVTLRLESGDLVMHDALSGEVLRTEAEAARIRAEASELRNAELEAEIQRLRDELKRKR
jgi:Uma2 family endonuclease